MIIINAYGEHAFGGRTQDTYVIYQVDSIEELQKHIDNKEIIVCHEPTRYHRFNIIEGESLQKRLVNLSEYMKIKEVGLDLLNLAEIKILESFACKGCRNNNGTLTATLRCRYDPGSDDRCLNYDEEFSFKTLFSRKKEA
ncbi:hypothetical protein [Paenibacillus donghaensis]|uniref:Uncharacterized protein n=1 Tax=Paenibacillus donghaensis TaxID=414771 RepID=A0A2Z2KJV0_9BACL|nr:hypothetical protein [Paenibacillus donghaensis]ASA22609.1 hypothetical protein B9T62_18555 [Paenibacillus donghaensis]